MRAGDIKMLYGKAAGRCSFPECRTELILEEKKTRETKQIGKIAHIIAHSDNGPRKDRSYSREKRNTYDNLILLCGTHHDIVDTMEPDYSIKGLRQMKKKHEAWVTISLEKEVINIGFAEFETAINVLLSGSIIEANTSFHLLPPEKKIKKNNLTKSTYNLIVTGLSRSREVGKYIENQSKLDEGYPERLKKGFRNEYDSLVDKGITGDDLFESMFQFSGGSSIDFKRQAAGLTVLVHLFELCEIFET